MAIVEKVDGFFIPNVTLIGVGAAKAIPERIVYLNATKPLLVTDKGIVHTGILKQITDILDEAAMEYAIYDETVPNPTDLNVAAGVELYKKEECDSLISIGGGSSHDCCKGIGLVVSNGGKIHDYEGVDKSTKAMPPYLAVNTTAGTASEITRFCIITDSARKVKMAIVDWRITPSVAINDPILMVGMPPALTAATGMDALTHAVEAYVSTGATPLTDACAEKAIKLVSENLRRAVANGSDIHAREGMCYAQYLAGMAFNNASLGHVHAMAHQLGGFYNLPHGECNAILLPIVEEYNLLAHLDKFINIARMMDENIDGLSKRDAAELAISAIRRLSQDVGIPASITELAKRYGKEVSRSDIPTMSVIDAGSVAGGDDAVLLEGGLQAGQGLHGGAGTGTLIGINDHRALLALDLYGNDLVLELALGHGLFALLLAVGGELIEHFAGQVPLLGNIFGSDAHVIVIESIPQGVIYHGIYQGSIAHAVAVTALHHGVGGERHALHTAGYYDIGIASLDHLSGHIDAVQTGTADDIDSNGGGGHRQASLQGSLTGDILAQTSLDNAAHVNMVDLLGGNAGAVQGLLDNDGTEFSGGNGAESTAHGADGGTAGACQNDFLHKCVPP